MAAFSASAKITMTDDPNSVDVFGNPTNLKPATWRVSDMRLAHDMLGSCHFQLQFVRADGKTAGYGWPLLSGETPEQVANRLYQMADGIRKTFKEK